MNKNVLPSADKRQFQIYECHDFLDFCAAFLSQHNVSDNSDDARKLSVLAYDKPGSGTAQKQIPVPLWSDRLTTAGDCMDAKYHNHTVALSDERN